MSKVSKSVFGGLKTGDVVFVRAIIDKIKVGDWKTGICVHEYQPGYPPTFYWKAEVNSVDVFPATKK